MHQCILSVNIIIVYTIRMSVDGVIKVADFGLSEEVYGNNYFRVNVDNPSQKEQIKLPIKWMALESIHDGLFSEKTDVVCLEYDNVSCYYCYFIFIVVLWNSMLGNLQSWKSSLSRIESQGSC